MAEKTIEQVKDEMLHRMFEEVCEARHGKTGADFARDEDGDYKRLDLQEAFIFFCEGRALSNLADRIDPKTGLKGCPFCGAKAERYPDGDMEGYSTMCSGKTDGPILFNTNTRKTCPMGTFGYISQEDADAAWNNRS